VEVRGTSEHAGQSDGPLQLAGRRPEPDRMTGAIKMLTRSAIVASAE